MLYNLQNVLALEHSAKGTTWSKHKYIRKENGRYYYPTNKSTVSNKFADSGAYYKVGNRYHTVDDINMGRAKMEAADKYNESVRLANKRYGGASSNSGARGEKFLNKKDSAISSAKEAYENAVSKYNDYQKNAEKKRSFGDKVTLKALNASASFKEKISKGKSLVAKLFKKK